MNKPKIYLFANRKMGSDVIGMAMAEDGHVLAGHFSSSEGFLKHDLGLTSDWKHTNYKAHYPDGYELEWVDKPLKHEGLLAAYDRNQQLAEQEQD